ncbi:unnamed protein product [Paramecium pentaurelia]|uniref:TLDc domain-containing protein n=1 Tax=Paramecium pentaurelia TaxID=43138 RepID=A0A8S1TTC1_9CILI|nr:unnamed protein product [Paramecium pentaurelia]
MYKAIPCKKHPIFFIQWVRILKKNIDFGCIKCLDEIQEKSHIIYVPEIIENPSILVHHIPVEEQYKTLYKNLNDFSEETLEKYYGQLEKSLNYLCEYLKNFIQNGRASLQEFKTKCKESRDQLYQQFKIDEIYQLINEFGLQDNQDVQDQIEKKLNAISEKVNDDLMKEQSSKIKTIFKETQLAIYKLNLNCNKQISEISVQIDSNTNQLKHYFCTSFNSIYSTGQTFNPYSKNQNQQSNQESIWVQSQSSSEFVQIERSTFQFSVNNLPYYSSRILPQFYFEYILNYASQWQNCAFQWQNQQILLKAYSIFEPKNEEIVSGQQFWNKNPQQQQKQSFHAIKRRQCSSSFDTQDQNYTKLIIFKSNNKGNPIFGYFRSDSLEFIFSYNHNEIYPIKQMKKNMQNLGGDIQQYQVKNQIYSQSFIVGNYDMEIHANLIDGKSMLGQDFIWDSQNNEIDQSEYLFGGAKPNIQLCEVFYF